MNTKPCKKCGGSERSPSGNCRPCNRVATAKYAANPNKGQRKTLLSDEAKAEKKKLSRAAWRSRNKDHIRAYNLKYSSENKQSERRNYPQRNRIRLSSEESKARSAARAIKYYENNKEKILARIAAKYAADPAKYLAASNSWKAKNKDKKAIHNHNRRARMRVVGGELSSGLAKKLFALQKGRCACCKQPLGDKYHLDHIMPIALGGENIDENIQLLTPTCNFRKHAKHPIDFMQSRGLLL